MVVAAQATTQDFNRSKKEGSSLVIPREWTKLSSDQKITIPGSIEGIGDGVIWHIGEGGSGTGQFEMEGTTKEFT